MNTTQTLKASLFAAFLACTMSACTHTEVESQKSEFESSAEKRLSSMEDNLKTLEQRRDQLLGQPKADLAVAIEALKSQIEKAKGELNKLEDSASAKWIDFKSNVDKELYNLDSAYGSALKVFTKEY